MESQPHARAYRSRRPRPRTWNHEPETVKILAKQEIDAVAGGLALDSYTVTAVGIMQTDNPDGSSDFYLFAADTGRLLGYYGAKELIPCSDDMFYIGAEPVPDHLQGLPAGRSGFVRAQRRAAR